MNTDVTRLLIAIESGDQLAASELLPFIYDELRRLAISKMKHEKQALTLQPTALVHEAFIRLVGSEDAQQWAGRNHFLAAAAEAMRRILIENARRRSRKKRGGDMVRIQLNDEDAILPDGSTDALLALDDALTKLSQQDEESSRLVELRYFAGLSVTETAKVLGVSPRTVKRNWAYARAWLRREIDDSAP